MAISLSLSQMALYSSLFRQKINYFPVNFNMCQTSMGQHNLCSMWNLHFSTTLTIPISASSCLQYAVQLHLTQESHILLTKVQ